MCHVSWFSQYCSLYVLTLTLMAITLDQYQAILNPLKPRMSLSKGILCIVIIWTLASCFSLPHAIYQTLFHYVYREKIIRSHCFPIFPKPSEVFRRYFDVSTFTLFYVLPLVVITVASVAVSKNLLLSKTIGAVTEAEATAQRRRKKRTIKMIVLLVMAFALCWFPLNVYTFLLTDQFVQFNNTLYFAFHWVAVSSTCWNPFIYFSMDNRFISDLKTLLAKCGRRIRTAGKNLPLTAVSGDGRQSGVRLEDNPGPSTENRSFYLRGCRGNNGEREDHQESLRPHFSEAVRRLQEELGPVNIRAALRPAVGGDYRSLRHREQEAMAEEKHWCCHGGPGRRLMPQEEEVHLDDCAAGGGLCSLLVPPQCLHLHALRPIQQHPPLCPPLGGRQQHLLEPHHLLLDGQQVPLQPHDPSGQVWGEKEERRQDPAAHRGQRRWEAVGVTLDDKPGPSTENRSFYLVGHRGKNGEREDHLKSLHPRFSEAFRSLQEEIAPVNLRVALPPAVGGDHRSLSRDEQEAVAEENHWCRHDGPGHHSTPQEEGDHLDDCVAGGGLCHMLFPPQRLHRPAPRPTCPIQQHPLLRHPLGGRELHLLEPLHLPLDGQQAPLRPHDPSSQVWGEKEERRQDPGASRSQRRWEAVGERLEDKSGPSMENRSFYLGGCRGNNGKVSAV